MITAHKNFNLEGSLVESFEKFLKSHKSCMICPSRGKYAPEARTPEITVYHIEPPGVTLIYAKGRPSVPSRFISDFMMVGTASIILIGEENKVEELDKKIDGLLGIENKPLVAGDIHIGARYTPGSDEDNNSTSSYCVIGD